VPTPRLYLIDTLFHIFRAYHALPRSLKAPDGHPINAVHGVMGILRTLCKTEHVTHIGTVFEGLSGIFREQICPDYKAHREPPPEDLVRQIPLVKSACRALGLSIWEADTFEADDVIGTLSRWALGQGCAVTIVSNDKDLAQLLALDGDIELLRSKGSGKSGSVERWRRDDVPAAFGVRADQMASFLALRGDPVDNIAGLKGVGAKTAARWLAQSGDLEGLLAQPQIGGKRWASVLAANAESLRRDLVLATIRTDVPLRPTLDQFVPAPFAGASDLFERLAMKSLHSQVGPLEAQGATIAQLWSAGPNPKLAHAAP
jgi:DNA polymerase-1